GVMVIGPPKSGIVGVSSLHADNNENDNRVKPASINLILILMIFPSGRNNLNYLDTDERDTTLS
ncbi:MAG: hypothetical protein KAS19_03835, partial [Anaerolineales bacterium]|nr:hypothetical protein [Anaerolineales bacterium]